MGACLHKYRYSSHEALHVGAWTKGMVCPENVYSAVCAEGVVLLALPSHSLEQNFLKGVFKFGHVQIYKAVF